MPKAKIWTQEEVQHFTQRLYTDVMDSVGHLIPEDTHISILGFSDYGDNGGNVFVASDCHDTELFQNALQVLIDVIDESSDKIEDFGAHHHAHETVH